MSSADVRFSCNAVTVFDLFGLKEWAKGELAAGRLTASRPALIEVVHPDREMDGSCRWCGCRENEVIRIDL